MPTDRRRPDQVQATATNTGKWGTTDYSKLGSYTISGNKLEGTAKKVEGIEQFGKDQQNGYFACVTFDPWEGTQARIKRGTWGKWTTCKDNGNVLFFLGSEDIEATEIEAKTAQGKVTKITVNVTKEE